MADSRQKQAGEKSRRMTRQKLLAAAVAEFAEAGYVASTVSRIAERAGVTTQTFYSAWGSKREVLRAYLTEALSSGADPGDAARARLASLAPADALGAVEAIATVSAEIALRASRAWALYRQAAAVDADIATDWRQLQRLRRGTVGTLVARIPPAALRPGLDAERAADTVWAIASPDTYDLFVNQLGRTLDEYHAWLNLTLRSSLLSPPADAEPARLPREHLAAARGN